MGESRTDHMVILAETEPLTDKNFVVYCAHYYDNPQCHTTEEFAEDVNRVKYIKKLITRYVEGGELREQLILNHIIILNNVFGPIHTCRILYLKLSNQFKYIKPFLVMLNILPDTLYNINNVAEIDTSMIPMDVNIITALRKINNA